MIRNTPKIFVSYTFRDGEISNSFLLQIEAYINEFGKVFIDMLHNDSLDKQSRVLNELISSDYLVLIKTKGILNSKWVQKEINLAKEKQIPVIELEYQQLKYGDFNPILTSIISGCIARTPDL